MSQILKCLRVLGDATRVRLAALLQQGELSVNELQRITRLSQPRISTHLGMLRETGLIESRREGRRTFYRLSRSPSPGAADCLRLAILGTHETHTHRSDLVNLKRVLQLRADRAQTYFSQVAGRYDRRYGPGRSWQAFGQFLLRILPPLDIADLGSGEGLLGELLARRARKVVCVDNSRRIVQFGQRKARRNGLGNLEFRHGDMEQPPIPPRSMDLVLFSQALHHAQSPQLAIAAAHRILRIGGQILILDLLQHDFANARDLYGDTWLGFAESDLHQWLEDAGFKAIEIALVAREAEAPHFQTLLATATR